MSLSHSTRTGVSKRIALEPVFNALNSFSLLSATQRLAGLNMWVVQTAASLAPERLYTNRLVFEGLRDALTPTTDAPDFPAYLRDLSEQDAYVVRDRALEGLRSRYARRIHSEEASTAPDAPRLLADVQAYLTCVEYVQIDAPFDTELQREAHALLNDAPAMHRLLVSHLEDLWKTSFAAEWKRVQRLLNSEVEMFDYTQSIDEEASIAEIFHTCTGRMLPADIDARLADAGEVILVPSWHTGRHVTLWESGASHATARLFFSEPPNYVVTMRSTPIGRGELRARLAALADETRLRIIELLAQHDEMHAQDIIAALDLSQSSISRHIKQLVSMGYLYERRGEGANKTYRLSSFYFARTARAIEQLVAEEDRETIPPSETDTTLSQELRRFLDRDGRLTVWPPAKQRDKLLILEYLASFFEQGRVYNEKEVNDLLLLHSIVKDSAALRRALYGYRFMNRARDGSRYWLIGSDSAEKEFDEC